MSVSKIKAKPKEKNSQTPTKFDKFGVTLSDIVEKPQLKTTTFGVVLDATGAYKTYDSVDYVTKLKIIDYTFNSNQNATTYKSFVHIFIFSETPESAPRISRVGDIVKLSNFDFREYQKSEVKGLFHKGQSDWAVYDGRVNANTVPISKSKSSTTGLSAAEKENLVNLRKWGEDFFGNNSIKNMSWFARDETQTAKEGAVLEVKDVDLVAKLLCDATFIVDETIYHKLAFADDDKNLYFAEYAGRFDNVAEGDVVKLRSISIFIALESRKIQFSSYSNILLLQKTSHDFLDVEKETKDVSYDQKDLELQEFEELQLDKLQKIQVGLNTFAFVSPDGADLNLNPSETLRTNYVRGYPMLENFMHQETDFGYNTSTGYKFFSKRGSAFLKQHQNGNYYTFKELNNIQNEILMNPEAASQYQHQKFLIRGYILATEYDTVFQTAKLYSPSLNRVWDFEFLAEAQSEAQDLQVILHNVLYMKDQSIESEQTTFPVYLITFDGNPQYIFSLWKLLPDYLEINRWAELNTAKENRFKEMLSNLKAPQYFYDMVVQLMVNNQGKVYFRVVDTLFWFFQ